MLTICHHEKKIESKCSLMLEVHILKSKLILLDSEDFAPLLMNTTPLKSEKICSPLILTFQK